MEDLSHTVVAVQIRGIWQGEIFPFGACEFVFAVLGQSRQSLGGYDGISLEIGDIPLVLENKSNARVGRLD
jgi:uncharacterized protein YjlB